MKTLPAMFHSLLSTVTDTHEVIAEHPRSDSLRTSVWELEAPDGTRWYAKQNAGPKLHRREVDAYTKWTAALGPDRTPTLVASDAETRTVLVTAVPGHSLDKLRLPAEQEREAYRQAGALLARLHAADPRPSSSTEAGSEWEADLEKLLAAAEAYLTIDDLKFLGALASKAPSGLNAVVAHGDYRPRNWMWDDREQYLRVIDFERTQREPAVRRDLSRLYYRDLYQRPDLAAAFASGYAHPLTPEEQQARIPYGVLDALDSVRFGTQHHDLELVDEAHTMIMNLRAEHTRSTVGR